MRGLKKVTFVHFALYTISRGAKIRTKETLFGEKVSFEQLVRPQLRLHAVS